MKKTTLKNLSLKWKRAELCGGCIVCMSEGLQWTPHKCKHFLAIIMFPLTKAKQPFLSLFTALLKTLEICRHATFFPDKFASLSIRTKGKSLPRKWGNQVGLLPCAARIQWSRAGCSSKTSLVHSSGVANVSTLLLSEQSFPNMLLWR